MWIGIGFPNILVFAFISISQILKPKLSRGLKGAKAPTFDSVTPFPQPVALSLILSRSLSRFSHMCMNALKCVIFYCWRCYCRNECILHKIALFLLSMHSSSRFRYTVHNVYGASESIKYKHNWYRTRLFWRSKVKTFGRCHLHKINDENGNPVVFCMKIRCCDGNRPLLASVCVCVMCVSSPNTETI